MSLRKKIIFSFFISAFVIAILAAYEYVNFVQVRNEMRFLEVTDSIRSKSLQLRRHEKNFFLFPEKSAQESAATRDYLSQLQDTANGLQSGDAASIDELRNQLSQYGMQFGTIESLLARISGDLDTLQVTNPGYAGIIPLMAADVRNKPMDVATFLGASLQLPPDNPQIQALQQLDSQINQLRDTGENILAASDSLDQNARAGADQGIRQSQIAILVFFPLFLLLGIGTLLYTGTSVVRRLRTLTDQVGRISARYARGGEETQTARGDEVDVLVDRFHRMNGQLIDWEQELDEKNQELYQTKKLAAIGTLAAGVAHEINNPLNNISLSAQVLQRQFQGEESARVREIVEEIVGQTARMKAIVGNLLEFAREREPQQVEIELTGLIRRAWSLVDATADTSGVDFVIDSDPAELTLKLDPNQMERVFVNLFSNAIAAMDGHGQLAVQVRIEYGNVHIYISDTGKGIPAEDREKIFDPFFTNKDKGTGLGLAIVMNIIKRHGGSITVLSEEGMGTVFEIVFPKGGE